MRLLLKQSIINEKTNLIVAIKLLFAFDAKQLDICNKEVELISQVKSQNCIKFIEKLVDEHSKMLIFISEFASKGDLEAYISKNQMTSAQIIEMFKKILYGIIDIQSTNIIHGNLKPHKILLNEQDLPKLTVFGDDTSSKILKSETQTSFYTPKEQDQEEFGPESDFYSAGMILLKMVSPTITDLAIMQIKSGIIPEDIKQSPNLPYLNSNFNTKRITQRKTGSNKSNSYVRTT